MYPGVERCRSILHPPGPEQLASAALKQHRRRETPHGGRVFSPLSVDPYVQKATEKIELPPVDGPEPQCVEQQSRRVPL